MYDQNISNESIQSMREAWTVIELIFIIVIIGILAAMALPRLAATRDDAKLATDVSNMALCVREASSKYLASNTHLASGDSKACDSVTCFDITYGTNVSDFIVSTNSSAANYCSNVTQLGGHLAKTYVFRGTSIIY